ncbi:MAG: helix-turn-helix domain-containing protein, partial [Clostridiaceae bacterium]
MRLTYGNYVRQKRMELEMSLRGLAARTDISPVYLSNIENDRCPAPTRKYLD